MSAMPAAAARAEDAAAPAAVGLGLKLAWQQELLAEDSAAQGPDFLEVHAENAMVAGGPRWRAWLQLRERYAFSVHGVGLSLGGLQPPCAQHLARLETVVERLQPRWVSEHLAWSAHAGQAFHDLLPMPYNAASLQRVCEHMDQLQTRLRRQVLIENPATYLQWQASTLSEVDFLRALQARTGCGLLLDLNNVYVSAVNQGGGLAQAQAFVDGLPAGAVQEVHLAGHAADVDGAGAPLLIDTHGAAVAEPVWALYRHMLSRLGPRPTLLERDQNLPPLQALLGELARMRDCQAEVLPRPAVRVESLA